MAERWRRGRCDVALFPRARGRRPRPTPRQLLARTLPAGRRDRTTSSRRAIAGRSQDLADTPFILRAACEAHDEAQRLVAAEGVRPRAVLRSADEERCAAAVLAGLGVSLMPRSLLRPGMASAEIREVALERRVMLAWREDLDSELVAALRDTAAAHPWPGRSGARDMRLDSRVSVPGLQTAVAASRLEAGGQKD